MQGEDRGEGRGKEKEDKKRWAGYSLVISVALYFRVV